MDEVAIGRALIVTESEDVDIGEGEARDIGEGEARDIGEGKAGDIGEGEAGDIGEGEAGDIGEGEAGDIGEGIEEEVGEGWTMFGSLPRNILGYCHVDNKAWFVIVNVKIIWEAGLAMARQRKLIRPGRERRQERQQRRRRPPEVARQEILDAAERVFVEFHPDQVGLKHIAREAGVSHALITHYFGTYAGLVEAALERRLVALREHMLLRLREAGVLSRPDELIAILFHTLEDPVHLRLMKWLVASERPSAMHAFALQQHGLQIIAHQVANAMTPTPSRAMIETIELALVTAVSAALGYAVSKYALSGAIGKPVSVELDAGVRRTLAGMLQSYLRDALEP